jgi:hypothetical protein
VGAPPDPRRWRWMAPVVVVSAGILLLASPIAWPCPLRALAGVSCPTCGMTRATRLALNGELGAALVMHPLVFLVVPLLTVYLAVELGGYVRSGRWGTSAKIPFGHFLFYGTVALLVGVWIARLCGALGGPV